MSRTWKIALLVMLVAVFAVAALGVAQPAPADPAASGPAGVAADLIAFFTSRANATVAGIIAGLLFKFVPAFKAITNEWIPVLTAATSFLVQIVEPSTANAGFFGDLLRTSAGVLAPVVLSAIDSRVSKFVFDGWLRGPTSAHWTKPM